ncbi:PadR family transcriptional regulator [Lachnospiraceae bacterium KK002]
MAEKQTAMTEAVYYILLSLQRPNHGYGIIQNTLELTGGRLELGAGTLYGALSTLMDKQWIRLYSEDKKSRRKKQYILTEQGLLALQQEVRRLEELVENGRHVLSVNAADLEIPEERCLPAAEVIPGGIS